MINNKRHTDVLPETVERRPPLVASATAGVKRTTKKQAVAGKSSRPLAGVKSEGKREDWPRAKSIEGVPCSAAHGWAAAFV